MALAEELVNNVVTSLAGNGGSITSTQTTFYVSSVAHMPTTGQFRGLLESVLGNGTGEIVLVTAVNTSTKQLTVQRNYEVNPGAASNPQSFLDGAAFSAVLTAGAVETYVSQNIGLQAVAESGAFTAEAGSIYLVTTGTGSFTATLPAPTILGQHITIRKVDTGTGVLTVSSVTNGGVMTGSLNTVPYSQNTISLAIQHENVEVLSDGTNWRIVGGFRRKPYFQGYASTAQTLTSGADTVINVDTVFFDPWSAYNTSTHEYVCPVAGIYRAGGQGRVNASGAMTIGVKIWKNGAAIVNGDFTTVPSGGTPALASLVDSLVQCNAGDTLQLAVYCNASGVGTSTDSYDNTFRVEYVSP
jgi:hypothetical protein